MSLTKPALQSQRFGAPPPQAVTRHSIFTVSAGGEKLGLPVSCVQTIFRIARITPIPLGPPEVVGLVNLRGKIVTAVSLRRRLGLPDSSTPEGAVAIGIEHRGESFALLVDEVGDVTSVEETARIIPPANLSSARIVLTNAVFRLENGILSVLDMDAILDFSRARANLRHS
jgi:purine-binding chemotaxis protein CheW